MARSFSLDIASTISGLLLQYDMFIPIMEFRAINTKERGIRFLADFNAKGDIIVTRKPRGRPAVDTSTAKASYRSQKRSNSVTVPLWGDEGELAYPGSRIRNVLGLLDLQTLQYKPPTISAPGRAQTNPLESLRITRLEEDPKQTQQKSALIQR